MRHINRLVLAGSMIALSGTPALAQDAPQAPATGDLKLDEIVVTARRKEESGQRVPVAITAVTQAQLREQSVTKVEDLPRLAPGLTITQSPRGGGAPNYTIRGQRGAANPTVLTDPSVAIYFAEVPLAHASGTNQSLFDLSSVQVLKGPQGTLFGRNSTAGALLIEPHAPTDRLEGYLMASAGDYAYKDLEAVLNVPLGDAVAVRAGAKISRRDGYLDNIATGQSLNDIHSDSFRLSVSLKPTSTFQSTFIGSYFKSGGAGTGAKFVHFEPAAVPLSLPAPFKAYLVSQLSADLAAEQALDRYDVLGVAANPGRAKDKAVSIQNNSILHISDDLLIKNIMAYRKVDNVHSDDFSGSGVDLFYTVGQLHSKQFTEEIQLQGKTGNLDYVAGLFYFQESGRDAAVSKQLAALAALVPTAFPVYSTYDVAVRSRSYAAFLHANYDLGALVDGLSLSGGVRLTHDRRRVMYHSIGRTPGSAPPAYSCSLPTPTPIPRNDPALCSFDSGKLTSTEPTYDVSVNYQVTPRTLVYIAHRSGYRSGSFNQAPAALNLDLTKSYQPEFVKDVEVGLKTDFDLAGMPTRLNLAGYYQWYSNIHRTVTVLTGGTSLVSVITNAAKAHIYGGEAELTVRPFEGLTLTGGYSLTRAKYTSWNNYYRTATGSLVLVDVSSSPFAYVPEHQFNITARYKLPVTEELGEPSIMLSYYGLSRQNTSDIGPATCEPAGGNNLDCLTRRFVLPAYQIFNARLEWNRVGGTDFDVSLFVNNITNRYYYTSSVNAIANLGTATAYQGAPRMFGATVRIPFGDR